MVNVLPFTRELHHHSEEPVMHFVHVILRDHPKSSTSPAKGNSLQRGAGGQEAHSYFLDRPGDVDFKNVVRDY